MLSIAIIDIIGLTYDGSTLSKRGLGGSESAVILISKELQKLGFEVTVFNNCIDKEATPGVYDGVTYIDHSSLDTNKNYHFDIVISSRTVIPFLPKELQNQFLKYNPERYDLINSNAKFRAIWMHDTFCNGDHLVEPLLVSGLVQEIFTLSDFHTVYTSTCDHGSGRRMFEVLKSKIFQTRNGAVQYKKEVDISSKDPYLCVYNASVTKGMIPLVTKMWERIKAEIPQAKLKVIGGYYRFRENAEPDAQEKTWRELVANKKYADLDIEFTGIIKQKEIADILSKASYTLHPGAFPETFGISSLESLLYNTPIVGCKFGAMEETAAHLTSYLIDYPIEPNGLYPRINAEFQETLYVKTVIQAMRDKYLHQQKMYACELVKDIAGWDSVALQWKQHLYKIFGVFLPVNEYRKVSYINNRVRKVFGRRFLNTEDNYVPSSKPQQKIVVITPVFNAENYINRCIESVISQDYDNWKMIIINDASTDNTTKILNNYNSHPNIIIINNPTNMGAVYNQVQTIKSYTKPTDIVMLLDGDDSLINDNQIFSYYNNLYDGNTEFTYGSCWSMVDSVPLIAQPYPEQVKQTKTYRQHRFNWNMPYTHLRTFLAKLISESEDSNFIDENGNWYKAGGDCSVFYTAIEAADPNKIKVVSDIIVNYNDINPLNDYKINGEEQTKNANAILGKSKKETMSTKPKFSVIIPTMWKAKEQLLNFLPTLNSHPLVGEIIIINNDSKNTPEIPVLNKLKLINTDENIGVNPAWNIGVYYSTYDILCLANDDIDFDTKVFDKLENLVTKDTGVFGLCPGEVKNWKQIPYTNGNIDIVEWKETDHTFGFGSLMFLHKDNWKNIPKELKIYYGDNFIFDTLLAENKKNYLIANIRHNTKWAQTTSDKTIVPEGTLEKEATFYNNVILKHLEQVMHNTKKILIAIPTNKDIKPDTFKAIYDLEVPEGFKTTFQYFYGYQIDQIRNLIAHWGTQFDYLFCVDSDISFKSDTLKKLLAHNKPIVGGIYIQRKPGQHILEVYTNGRNTPYEEIADKSLVEVEALGFGCVLINSDVLRNMEYPHFVYKSAIDHRYTVSEDVYFCKKAKSLGFNSYVDPSITCKHHGDWVFEVNTSINNEKSMSKPNWTNRLAELGNQRLLPREMVAHIHAMKKASIEPKVIYDIGSCVLHWTSEAKQVWPQAKYFGFEAMQEVKSLYDTTKVFEDYHLGVLSDVDGKEVTFYQNTEHPGGNSYYKENEEVNPEAPLFFNDSHATKRITRTLDSIVEEKNLPYPDLIKIDVQGAELDIFKGAQKTLEHCNYILAELQSVEYNKGAPHKDEIITYLETKGFKLVKQITPNPKYDGDYFFVKMIF